MAGNSWGLCGREPPFLIPSSEGVEGFYSYFSDSNWNVLRAFVQKSDIPPNQ